MKVKKIILTLICIIILIPIIICFPSKEYTIKIKKVDYFSPERTLEVYVNDKKTNNYKEIQYTDNTILCYSSNPTVSYIDLIGEEVLVVVLKNNKKVKAKIIED